MSVLIEHALFFVYVGLALGVATVSFFWGTQSKIMGASLLLASILLANIIYSLFEEGIILFNTLNLVYAIFDLILAALFLTLFKRTSPLERNRWAGVVALIHIMMAAIDILGSSGLAFADRFSYGLTLNLLTIAALITCLIAFIPKSWDEAIGVLRMKWLYLMADLFMRTEASSWQKRHIMMPVKFKNSAPKMIDAHIGAKIREARIIRNKSREDLAQALSVSVAQVQKYESGTNRVSANTLYSISQILEIDIRHFYEGIDLAAFKNLTLRSQKS